MENFLDLYTKHLGSPMRMGRKEYLYKCWLCGKPKLYVNVATGAYCCHVCRNSPTGFGCGNAEKFAKVMGDTSNTKYVAPINLPPPKKDNFDQQIATKVYTYLIDNTSLSKQDSDHIKIKRGISNPARSPYRLRSTEDAEQVLRKQFSVEELIASGLFYVHEESGKFLPHRTLYRGRVLIPYMDLDRNVNFVRSRANNKKDRVGYIGPIGAKTGKYLWSAVSQDYYETNNLVVTEGEFKAMTAVEHGIDCIALPGMNAAHDTLKLFCLANNIGKVTICFDHQLKKMENVVGAAKSLARTLTSGNTGIKVYNAILPLVPEIDDAQKIDIDSFIVHFGADEFNDIIDDARLLVVSK